MRILEGIIAICSLCTAVLALAWLVGGHGAAASIIFHAACLLATVTGGTVLAIVGAIALEALGEVRSRGCL